MWVKAHKGYIPSEGRRGRIHNVAINKGVSFTQKNPRKTYRLIHTHISPTHRRPVSHRNYN